MSDFNEELVEILPDLKRYARSLCRSEHDAEDLLQDCVERVLTKEALFERGSNLRAWTFTTMRNIFLSGKRREKVFDRYVEMVGKRDSSQPASQMDRYFLTQAMDAVSTLSPEEREAIRLLVIEDRRHKDAAEIAGQPVGTMKSRLSRGRAKLRNMMALGGANEAFEASQPA